MKTWCNTHVHDGRLQMTVSCAQLSAACCGSHTPTSHSVTTIEGNVLQVGMTVTHRLMQGSHGSTDHCPVTVMDVCVYPVCVNKSDWISPV